MSVHSELLKGLSLQNTTSANSCHPPLLIVSFLSTHRRGPVSKKYPSALELLNTDGRRSTRRLEVSSCKQIMVDSLNEMGIERSHGHVTILVLSVGDPQMEEIDHGKEKKCWSVCYNITAITARFYARNWPATPYLRSARSPIRR